MSKQISPSKNQPYLGAMSFNKDFKSYSNDPFIGHYKEEKHQNIEKLKESFFRNPRFKVVYKNFNYDEPLWVWIGEGNLDYDQVGYKKMLSYPYDEYKFDIGDYISCVYGGVETTWLITSLSKSREYTTGRIEKTNNSLRWVDNYGKVLSYRCVIDDKYLEAYPRKIPSFSRRR